jgi:hypothetical protein
MGSVVLGKHTTKYINALGAFIESAQIEIQKFFPYILTWWKCRIGGRHFDLKDDIISKLCRQLFPTSCIAALF